MEDAPKIPQSKRWRENLLPGNLKEMHVWAHSLESCKSTQWGDPTGPFVLFSAAGNGLCPQDLLWLGPLPGVLLTLRSGCASCPRTTAISGPLQDSFICSLCVEKEIPGLFNLIRRQKVLLDHHTRRNLNQERFALPTACQANTAARLWLRSEILHITSLKIALGCWSGWSLQGKDQTEWLSLRKLL